jgi:hypothetical protein
MKLLNYTPTKKMFYKLIEGKFKKILFLCSQIIIKNQYEKTPTFFYKILFCV